MEIQVIEVLLLLLLVKQYPMHTVTITINAMTFHG